jgi:hypothetical protein
MPVFSHQLMRALHEEFVGSGPDGFTISGSPLICLSIARDTKDFDLFLRRADVASALAIWEKAGYKADFVFDHWLAKVPREMFTWM